MACDSFIENKKIKKFKSTIAIKNNTQIQLTKNDYNQEAAKNPKQDNKTKQQYNNESKLSGFL